MSCRRRLKTRSNKKPRPPNSTGASGRAKKSKGAAADADADAGEMPSLDDQRRSRSLQRGRPTSPRTMVKLLPKMETAKRVAKRSGEDGAAVAAAEGGALTGKANSILFSR